jgi:DNA-directed RNA polymerase specialized sigma24 family protein
MRTKMATSRRKAAEHREARQKRDLTTTSLEDPVPPERIRNYEEPFELAPREEVLNFSSTAPEDEAVVDEQRVHVLPARLRHLFIMHELHHVSLREIAVLARISEAEAAHRLADARDRVGIVS